MLVGVFGIAKGKNATKKPRTPNDRRAKRIQKEPFPCKAVARADARVGLRVQGVEERAGDEGVRPDFGF